MQCIILMPVIDSLSLSQASLSKSCVSSLYDNNRAMLHVWLCYVFRWEGLSKFRFSILTLLCVCMMWYICSGLTKLDIKNSHRGQKACTSALKASIFLRSTQESSLNSFFSQKGVKELKSMSPLLLQPLSITDTKYLAYYQWEKVGW